MEKEKLQVKVAPLNLGNRVYVETKEGFIEGKVVSIPLGGGKYNNVKIALENGNYVNKNAYDTTFYELANN